MTPASPQDGDRKPPGAARWEPRRLHSRREGGGQVIIPTARAGSHRGGLPRNDVDAVVGVDEGDKRHQCRELVIVVVLGRICPGLVGDTAGGIGDAGDSRATADLGPSIRTCRCLWDPSSLSWKSADYLWLWGMVPLALALGYGPCAFQARHDPSGPQRDDRHGLEQVPRLALGGDCLAHVAMLRAQPELFGPVGLRPGDPW